MPSSNTPPKPTYPRFSTGPLASDDRGLSYPAPHRLHVQPTGGAALTVTPWIASELVPSWLVPFTIDENTRFTRTPDHLLRRHHPEEDGAVDAEADDRAHDVDEAAIEHDPVTAEAEGSDDFAFASRHWSFMPVEDETVDQAAVYPQEQDEQVETEAGLAVPEMMPQAGAMEEMTSEDMAVADVAMEEAATAQVAASSDVPSAEIRMNDVSQSADDVPVETDAQPELMSAEAAPSTQDVPIADADLLADVPPRLHALARLVVIGRIALPEPAIEQDLLPPEPEPVVEEPAAAEDANPEPILQKDEEPAGSSALSSQGIFTISGFGWPLYQQSVTIGATAPAAPQPPAEAGVEEQEQEPAQEPEADILGDVVSVAEQDPVEEDAPAPVVEERPEAAQVMFASEGYELPSLELLAEPPVVEPPFDLSEEFLEQNSQTLQQTLRDFGVRGEIIDANPGPVVTLYELEPAPGTKSSRVIGLSADIARSMSAISARVAVVEGRNVIGIELPNRVRETVWLRELLADHGFGEARAKLGLCLGKTIGGEPVIADLARMPHLLVAGTTGSGKSVAINTMILSLLYRHAPEACRLIMIDPKMLELSVYEGIPHLLTPVVTDPKKAITALKWAVREMEDRYRKMSRLAVRNIDGFNARVTEAAANGEVITRIVERGFDKETGEMVSEEEVMDLTPLPYIVIIVDEMADLMMVAGKEIEGAIQRLAQMARAAGIHLVMATQRPSVDVITGTIKANFPTRISFQVTSKIDSRTILGEMGAEQLLGQGDMLYMAGGGRITRVHGPFVSDHEVEKVVAHLKTQGRPEYLDAVTSDEEDEVAAEEDAGAVFDKSAMAEEGGGDHYEQAIAVVLRDRKASTSYIQRRLQIGYNKAASLMERMEQEGIVGPANHAGKREILASRAPSGL
ncbi:DNA translocase FtsK [Azorhizobium oxalatiphilum]|nr:DNA translocase FtsK [Azorhizobium oxalatiphilum]